jgi:predicted AlkP superfamily phosphohydrolase/phosphomutase
MGLDCAAPDLVFNRFRSRIPNIAAMVDEGASGTLASTDPPITIPAWMSMMTGKDAGQLGIYGFRHRKNKSYDEIWISSAESIRARKVWDLVGGAGGKSCIVAVPPTYPPPKISGWLISCFITPDTNRRYTSPPELAGEVEDLVGEYVPDVKFRVEDRNALLKQVYDMTERRFQVIEYLLQEKPWNFFAFVEIGLDRIHHSFWKFFDKTHHLYTPGNEFENVIGDYYSYLDRWVGRLRESIPRGTPTLIVSDHGAKPMKGAFCINQWLASKGYLALEDPGEVISLNDAKIDWERTRAWGWGGYYARVFLNVAGREEKGIIPPGRYERERRQIAREISEIRGPGGESWQTIVIFPDKHFEPLNGDPPDLMVYFDDLYWRSAGTVGHRDMYLPENDTGPDDAVHAKEGIYISSGFGSCGWEPRNILDIAPTCLKAMGLPIPGDMRGESI